MKINYLDSVRDVIEPTKSQTANKKARAELMIATHKTALRWNTTQAAAEKRIGLTQPRLNGLLKGHINRFSLDSLNNHTFLARLEVEVAPSTF